MTRRLVVFLFTATATATVAVQSAVADAGEIHLNGHKFTLPGGFTIECVAGPPLVDRPIVADFDEEGRLYVADSAGVNDKVQRQLETKPHRIVRLEDTDADGVFDQSSVFADKMMFPEGTLWHDGSLYVSAPPSIWKLTDTDGDGVCDERVEWFQGKTLTGCANDLHGPYLGLDGRIYWCKGAFAKQTYPRPGKAPWVTRAAHIFRCRTDGTEIEPVMTGGMDNPIDVVFTPEGERIFTTTFLQHPRAGRRDGLIHAIYGGVYGKRHAVLDNHPWTGPETMPVLSHLGAAAPCGLARYRSTPFGCGFGRGFANNLFACNFNLHKVTRHVLRPAGATLASTDSDFVSSDSPDFHPTDVLADADGSLLIIDTGGWYKLCCPTSQLSKPDVLGAVYRVRKVGPSPVRDPRGHSLAWEAMSAAELTRKLGDPRPAVRSRAIATLAKRGDPAVRALRARLDSRSVRARRNAVWSLTRIDSPAARQAVLQSLVDGSPSVRQAALHSVGLWRDRHALSLIRRNLVSGPLSVRRAAAEALGRTGSARDVGALLGAAGYSSDRAYQHSITYALIEIGAGTTIAAGLQSPNPRIRQTALVALDQIGHPLRPENVLPFLNSRAQGDVQTGEWVLGRHPEWADALAKLFEERLAAPALPLQVAGELRDLLARFAGQPSIQTLMARKLADPSTSPQVQQLLLGAMAAARVKKTPRSWSRQLAARLRRTTALLPDAVFTLTRLPKPTESSPDLLKAIVAVSQNDRLAPLVRLQALSARPKNSPLDAEQFELTTTALLKGTTVAERMRAVEVLLASQLTDSQLLTLLDALPAAGALEISRLWPRFEKVTHDKVAREVVSVLEAPQVGGAVHPALVRAWLGKTSPAVQQRGKHLLTLLDEDTDTQRAKLEQLAKHLKQGDPRRGQLVYHNAKTACASCHAIGYLGGRIGPDLTRVGSRRTERDLLEAIVFPSASIVRSYEPVLVITKEGEAHNGVVREDSSAALVLVTGPTQEVRVPRTSIVEMRPSTTSIMPGGLADQLTPAQIADLVAFLKVAQ